MRKHLLLVIVFCAALFSIVNLSDIGVNGAPDGVARVVDVTNYPSYVPKPFDVELFSGEKLTLRIKDRIPSRNYLVDENTIDNPYIFWFLQSFIPLYSTNSCTSPPIFIDTAADCLMLKAKANIGQDVPQSIFTNSEDYINVNKKKIFDDITLRAIDVKTLRNLLYSTNPSFVSELEKAIIQWIDYLEFDGMLYLDKRAEIFNTLYYVATERNLANLRKRVIDIGLFYFNKDLELSKNSRQFKYRVFNGGIVIGYLNKPSDSKVYYLYYPPIEVTAEMDTVFDKMIGEKPIDTDYFDPVRFYDRAIYSLVVDNYWTKKWIDKTNWLGSNTKEKTLYGIERVFSNMERYSTERDRVTSPVIFEKIKLLLDRKSVLVDLEGFAIKRIEDIVHDFTADVDYVGVIVAKMWLTFFPEIFPNYLDFVDTRAKIYVGEYKKFIKDIANNKYVHIEEKSDRKIFISYLSRAFDISSNLEYVETKGKITATESAFLIIGLKYPDEVLSEIIKKLRLLTTDYTIKDQWRYVKINGDLGAQIIGLKGLIERLGRVYEIESDLIKELEAPESERKFNQATNPNPTQYVYKQEIASILENVVNEETGETDLSSMINYAKNKNNKHRLDVVSASLKTVGDDLPRKVLLKEMLEAFIQDANEVDFEIIQKSIESLGYIGDQNTIQILENLKSQIKAGSPISWLDSLSTDLIDSYESYIIKLIDDAILRLGGVPNIKEDTKQAPIPKEVACPPGQNPGSGNQISISGNQGAQTNNGRIFLTSYSAPEWRLVEFVQKQILSTELKTSNKNLISEYFYSGQLTGGERKYCVATDSYPSLTVYSINPSGGYTNKNYLCNSCSNGNCVGATEGIVEIEDFSISPKRTILYAVSNKASKFGSSTSYSVYTLYNYKITVDGIEYQILPTVGPYYEYNGKLWTSQRYLNQPSGLTYEDAIRRAKGQQPPPSDQDYLSCVSPNIVTDSNSCISRGGTVMSQHRYGVCCSGLKCKNPALKDAVQKFYDDQLNFWSGNGGKPIGGVDVNDPDFITENLALYEQIAVLGGEAAKNIFKTGGKDAIKPIIKAADKLKEALDKKYDEEIGRGKVEEAIKSIKSYAEAKDDLGFREWVTYNGYFDISDLHSIELEKEVGPVTWAFVVKNYGQLIKLQEFFIRNYKDPEVTEISSPYGTAVFESYNVKKASDWYDQNWKSLKLWQQEIYSRAIMEMEATNRLNRDREDTMMAFIRNNENERFNKAIEAEYEFRRQAAYEFLSQLGKESQKPPPILTDPGGTLGMWIESDDRLYEKMDKTFGLQGQVALSIVGADTVTDLIALPSMIYAYAKGEDFQGRFGKAMLGAAIVGTVVPGVSQSWFRSLFKYVSKVDSIMKLVDPSIFKRFFGQLERLNMVRREAGVFKLFGQEGAELFARLADSMPSAGILSKVLRRANGEIAGTFIGYVKQADNLIDGGGDVVKASQPIGSKYLVIRHFDATGHGLKATEGGITTSIFDEVHAGADGATIASDPQGLKKYVENMEESMKGVQTKIAKSDGTFKSVDISPTFVAAKLDTETGVLEYVTGGSGARMYKISPDRTVTPLTEQGYNLGQASKPHIIQNIQLQPGDRIVTVTDGITDRIGTGKRGINGMLRDSAQKTPEQMGQDVVSAVESEINDMRKIGQANEIDDFSISIAEYNPPKPRAASRTVAAASKHLGSLKPNVIVSQEDIVREFGVAIKPNPGVYNRLPGKSKTSSIETVGNLVYVVQEMAEEFGVGSIRALKNELAMRKIAQEFRLTQFKIPDAVGYITDDGKPILISKYIDNAVDDTDLFLNMNKQMRAEFGTFKHIFGVAETNIEGIIFDGSNAWWLDFAPSFGKVGDLSSIKPQEFRVIMDIAPNEPWLSLKSTNKLSDFTAEINKWKAISSQPGFDSRLTGILAESGYTNDEIRGIVETVNQNIQNLERNLQSRINLANRVIEGSI